MNAGQGPNRRFAFTTAPLADLKRAGKGHGATVNDALLAAVAGMLRRYLQVAGEPSDKPLVALVPVSVRRPGEAGGNGSRRCPSTCPSTSPTRSPGSCASTPR